MQTGFVFQNKDRQSESFGQFFTVTNKGKVVFVDSIAEARLYYGIKKAELGIPHNCKAVKVNISLSLIV